MAFKPIGPCRVFVGRFTTTLSSITELTDVESVQLDLGIRMPWTSNANLDGVPTVDGLYYHTPRPQIQMTLVDADLDQFEAMLPITRTTTTSIDALGFGSSFTQIAAADVPSMFILPRTENNDGINAQHGIWIPGVRIAGMNGITFTRTGDQEIQQAYTVQVDAVYRETDQATDAIPEAGRIIWMGDPAGLGLSTWAPTLPS